MKATVPWRGHGRIGASAGAISLVIVAAALPVVGSAAPAAEPEAFFMVIYGAQQEGAHPETSHCFATFARFEASTGTEPRVELHHINWFSRRGLETGLALGLAEPDGRPVEPEPGENRSSREALVLAMRGGLNVTRCGPYKIEKELYLRALRQVELLEGRVPGRRALYKQVDVGYRHDRVPALNCIHAISDIDTDNGPLHTGLDYGERAACRVVAHLRRWIRAKGLDHPREWERIWRQTWHPDAPPDAEPARRSVGALGSRDSVE